MDKKKMKFLIESTLTPSTSYVTKKSFKLTKKKDLPKRTRKGEIVIICSPFQLPQKLKVYEKK